MQAIEREQEWKDIHKRALLNESFVEVSLDITDPDALADATSQDNGAIYTSQSNKVAAPVEKITHTYGTLEQNLWCLDGSRQAIPESDFRDETYASDVLSDETCVFSPKRPAITIGFTKTHDKLIPGITITWSETYEEYADTFEVIVYKANNIVFTKEVTGNKSIKTIVFLEFADYDKVEVIIKKWCLPNRRARVEGILVGLHKVYGKKELFDYSHKQHVDPISTSLPKSEITFSVNNVDGEYDLNNPQGFSKYLTERQELKVRYGLKMDDGSIEWVNGGVFYLTEWHAKQNGMTADFTARDVFSFLTDVYNDTSYHGTARDLYEIAETLLEAANLPRKGEDGWVIDKSLSVLGGSEYVNTTCSLPEDTIANNLQLVANAGRCLLYQDMDGKIHIEPYEPNEIYDTDYEINSFNSYSKSEISLSKPLRQVKVKTHSYGWNSNGEPVITEGEQSYSETSSPLDGETIVVDNPIISNNVMARDVAKWVYSYLKNRKTLESSWRADVRLDALDLVKIPNNYNTDIVRMTDVEYTYNGAFRATGKGRVIGNG